MALEGNLRGQLWAQLQRHAAEQGISISELTADALARLVEDDRRYSAVRERALARLRNAPSLGTTGRIPWTRDEIHER